MVEEASLQAKIFPPVAIALGALLSGCAVINYKTVEFNPLKKPSGPVSHVLMVERGFEAGHVLQTDDLYELDLAGDGDENWLPVPCKDAVVGCKLADDVSTGDKLTIGSITQDGLARMFKGNPHDGQPDQDLVCKHRRAFAGGFPCIDTKIGDSNSLVYLVNHDIRKGQEIGPDDFRAVAYPNGRGGAASVELREFIVGKVSSFGFKGKGWRLPLPIYEPNDQNIAYSDLGGFDKCFVTLREVKAYEKLKESDFKLGSGLEVRKVFLSALSHPSLIAGKVARRHLAKGEIIHVLDVGE